MADNKSLKNAKKQKQDEFYTQLSDIEKELIHYKNHFKGKVVYCNCDDPYESNFVKYFVLQFNELGLKKLIATSYLNSTISNKEVNILNYNSSFGYKFEIDSMEDYNGDGCIDLLDFKYYLENINPPTKLNGTGDFRSLECVELLKQADIVVTNPPFSLFREYVAQLMKFKKKFLIIGNINAISYKEIFPLIKNNEIWMGATYFNGGAAYFIADENLYNPTKMSNPKNAYFKDGKFYWRVNGVRWYTNLDFKKRHDTFCLYKKYTPELYPKYDNYDAININKVVDIPEDYNGLMGVPISFLDKYNPDQFELVGEANHGIDNKFDLFKPMLNGKECFKKLIIRLKNPTKTP